MSLPTTSDPDTVASHFLPPAPALGICPSSSDLSLAPRTKSHPPSAFRVPQYAHLPLLGTPAPAPPALRNPSVPPSLAMSLWIPQMCSQTPTSQPVCFSLSVPEESPPHPIATCPSFLPSVAPGPVGPRHLIVGRPPPPLKERVLPHRLGITSAETFSACLLSSSCSSMDGLREERD